MANGSKNYTWYQAVINKKCKGRVQPSPGSPAAKQATVSIQQGQTVDVELNGDHLKKVYSAEGPREKGAECQIRIKNSRGMYGYYLVPFGVVTACTRK